MTKLEILENEIYDAGINTWDFPPDSPYLGGRVGRILCADDHIHIFISNRLRAPARLCTLAHEFGHYNVGFSDRAYADTVRADRDERRAWQWAYNRLVPADQLNAYVYGHTYDCDADRVNLYELAQEFEITEWFARDALNYYAGKKDCYSHAEWALHDMLYVIEKPHLTLLDMNSSHMR